MNIEKIEGIGPKNAAALLKAGVKTTEGLLKAGATKKGRQELAEKTKISESNILGWVNRADLMRVKGVGEEYSDLLEAAVVAAGQVVEHVVGLEHEPDVPVAEAAELGVRERLDLAQPPGADQRAGAKVERFEALKGVQQARSRGAGIRAVRAKAHRVERLEQQ